MTDPLDHPGDDPLDRIDWPVRTPRLSLRRMTVDDVEPTFRFRRLEEVSHWITYAPQDLDSFRDQMLRPGRIASTLVVVRDGEVIGDLMLKVGDAWAQAEVAHLARGVQAELGWVLDPAYAGHGYATEAVEAVVELCFTTLGLRRVLAECFADNTPSWRLMERLGMRRENHTVRESLHRSGRWLDGYTYALLAEEWLTRRQRTGAPAGG